MRFETRRVRIVVITLNRAVGIKSARFEHDLAVAVTYDKVQPGAAGRERRRHFVASEVPDDDLGIQPGGIVVHPFDADLSSLRLQEGNRAVRSVAQLLR